MFKVASTIKGYKKHILEVLKDHERRSGEPYAIQIDWGEICFAFLDRIYGDMVPIRHLPTHDPKMFEQAARELEAEKVLVRYPQFTIEDRGSTCSYIIGLPEKREAFKREALSKRVTTMGRLDGGLSVPPVLSH